MSWKCKKCGGEIFRGVSGKFTGIETNFNKKGESYDTDELQLDTTWKEEYQCENCYEESLSIEDIANWED